MGDDMEFVSRFLEQFLKWSSPSSDSDEIGLIRLTLSWTVVLSVVQLNPTLAFPTFLERVVQRQRFFAYERDEEVD